VIESAGTLTATLYKTGSSIYTETVSQSSDYTFSTVLVDIGSGSYYWSVSDTVTTVTNQSAPTVINAIPSAPGNYQPIIPEGDPKLFFSADGATLRFQNGVPIMDNEFENLVNLQVIVNQNTPLNRIASNINEMIGSTLPDEITKTITRDQMEIIESAAEQSLSSLVESGVFQSVTARMSYVSNLGYTLDIAIIPPTGPEKKLSFVRYSENWVARQSVE
jgi:hypothetical protein